MLDKLKDLLKVSGRLTAKIIDAAQDMPSSVTYMNHFGGWGEPMLWQAGDLSVISLL